jgi:hypothetical protein
MNYEEFSLSQMANTNDLIDCFDTICSVQTVTNKKLLVFMDEINCKIEGNEAVSLLLSPIWDGSFIRGGKRYRISPAFWVFASTAPISDLVEIPNKGSDFVSRLNGPILELDKLATKEHGGRVLEILKVLRKGSAENPDGYLNDQLYKEHYEEFLKLKGEFRTDQVYLGVSLLNHMWGPISKIRGSVLKLFHDLCLINGVRSLEFFVSKFHNIVGGEVDIENVPNIENFNELKRHVIIAPEEQEKQEEANNDEIREKPVPEHLLEKLIDIEIEPLG